jgi:RNA polymerase sigma-70 factor (ECF subfamily)
LSGREAYLELYLAHRAALVDYAAPIVGDRARAEDVVQEAWLRFSAAAEKERADADRIAQPIGYLYRIVRNLATDVARRLSADSWTEAAPALEETAAPGADPEQQAADRNALRIVAAALAELPPRTRLAFDLHRFGDKTFAEIGRQLGISQTRAHNLVQEALAHCMRHLAGSAEEIGVSNVSSLKGAKDDG